MTPPGPHATRVKSLAVHQGRSIGNAANGDVASRLWSGDRWRFDPPAVSVQRNQPAGRLHDRAGSVPVTSAFWTHNRVGALS